jgi:secreted Zn-dependent insulinase-like peptidase
LDIKTDVQGLSVPPPNDLIPQQVSLLEKDELFSDVPHLVKYYGDSELWYLKDDTFGQPRGTVQLKILTDDLEFGSIPSKPYRS